MASTLIKARTNSRYRRTNGIIIAIALLLTIFAVGMGLFSIIRKQYLFVVAYFIAAILLGTYVIIRINTIFSTYIAADKANLYMKNWSNDFLPYDYDNKVKILSEFIPAKKKLLEIPLEEINIVLIGSKNFIKRYLESDSVFVKNIRKLENSKDFYRKRTISSMEIMYVETFDGDCCYMPIVQFDTKNVTKILKLIGQSNPDVFFKSSSRAYRRISMA